MNLLDSLLLKAPRIDVWVAIRTDGAVGSGTENDPYNGSPRQESPIQVSNLASAGREATATTAVNHGYADGEVVTIAGVTGSGVQYYNGAFVIYGVTPNTFKYWMRKDPGAAASGAVTCARTFYQFDEMLTRLVPGTTVHLGPGVFPTRGFNEATGGSQPQSRQKFLGSGMAATTIRLVNASIPSNKYWVIKAGPHLEYFEISDLTLDCNLDGQAIAGYTFPPIACGGIAVSGAHLRYRRVRAINFGTLDKPKEVFVLWSAGGDPDATVESVDCVTEDCVVEQPAINQYGLITCITMGAVENPTGSMGYHRACVLRNNVIDCEFRINPVAISQITCSGTAATVTTRVPHGRASGDWVRITGALVNGSSANAFNGSFRINNATGTTFEYTIPSCPAAQASGDIWLDRFPSQLVPVANIFATGTGTEVIVTLTTKTPHFRVPGDNVVVSETVPEGYNGSFEVTNVVSPFQLEYKLSSNPGAWTTVGFIGVALQGLSIDGGKEAVAEGNRILNTRIGGPYHDTHSSRSVIVRNNYYRAVATGPYHYMGNTSAPTPASSLTHSGADGKTATFTINSSKPHGFTVGQGARISGAKIQNADPPLNTYNGAYAIESIPTPTSFTYRMVNDPGADANAGSGTVEALWQVQNCLIENNVIELIPSVMSWGAPVGIALVAAPFTDMTGFRVFRQLVIRNNVIGYVDNLTEDVVRNLGIEISYVEDASVEQNVVDLAISSPIRHRSCTIVRYFNNTDSAGKLIQGASDPQPNVVPPVSQDELTTLIDDAAILCFV